MDDPFKPTSSKPVEEKSPEASALVPGITLRGKLSRVNGLLVAVLEGGRTAGVTSQMNAVVVPSDEGGEASLAACRTYIGNSPNFSKLSDFSFIQCPVI